MEAVEAVLAAAVAVQLDSLEVQQQAVRLTRIAEFAVHVRSALDSVADAGSVQAAMASAADVVAALDAEPTGSS